MIIGMAGVIIEDGAITMDGAVAADLQIIESGASSAAFFRLQQTLWERACSR